ncbi:uncharacterized protein LOC104436956 isoform X4 [Eucalyptus grandis]|uniref:uncharacterized protein LOC104436956 isoform X4 n=1 Tax=Eucalyptus grandis TaxID=71139 RepID=UPI00192EB1BE|nr:uncharacterized protein LOC104436956 isoform X4 [Eucalyptus grandis]
MIKKLKKDTRPKASDGSPFLILSRHSSSRVLSCGIALPPSTSSRARSPFDFNRNLSKTRHRGQGCSRNTKRCSERRELIWTFSWFAMTQTYLSGLLLSRDHRRLLLRVVFSSSHLLYLSSIHCSHLKFVS